MNTPHQNRVTNILRTLARELASVHSMLISFEESSSKANRTMTSAADFQNFDLALQLLKDLEKATELLEDNIPKDMAIVGEFPVKKLTLGRTRDQFRLSLGAAQAPENAPKPQAIDLF